MWRHSNITALTFLHNSFAKNYQNPLMYVKSYSKPNFWTQCRNLENFKEASLHTLFTSRYIWVIKYTAASGHSTAVLTKMRWATIWQNNASCCTMKSMTLMCSMLTQSCCKFTDAIVWSCPLIPYSHSVKKMTGITGLITVPNFTIMLNCDHNLQLLRYAMPSNFRK